MFFSLLSVLGVFLSFDYGQVEVLFVNENVCLGVASKGTGLGVSVLSFYYSRLLWGAGLGSVQGRK